MPKTATVGAVLALGASAFLAGAPAGSASGSGTTCPSGRVCFYFNSVFQGARADDAYTDAGMGNELFTDGPTVRNGWGVHINNNAASVMNNSGHILYLYTEPNCDARSMVGGGGLFPGTRYNLSAFNAKNDISSLHIAGTGDCIHRDHSWA
ncbi:hypothetical protein GA0061083_0014 [Pseudarthrobacter enclensis]|uniref:Peptidase inhibitor family I36 n=1 Tax=Pseudarthrobacter enclensis TaxID=993070 RepID=A0A0V8I5B5_9MICC|nr:peptidase inhibitor family I36 protein [Pseudarthrobacter enclensis]KSU69987.1 hypothetical protein AS031_18160 [Pseudarthrobacter enclensis]SCC29696.1 hypothetical protein GA0061083_0014 [Pseudarthrobacter enclensis]